jgi:hypothetical protein
MRKKISSPAFSVQAGNADRPKAQHNRPVPGAKRALRLNDRSALAPEAPDNDARQGKTDAET